jgi:hypothetical protein
VVPSASLKARLRGQSRKTKGKTGTRLVNGEPCHAVTRDQASKSSPALTGIRLRSATQKIAYVAASRGREGIEAFVESVADLSQIQNRSGDGKAAVEMALLAGPERSAGRNEAAFAAPAADTRRQRGGRACPNGELV